jgi:hypothetical protein
MTERLSTLSGGLEGPLRAALIHQPLRSGFGMGDGWDNDPKLTLAIGAMLRYLGI